MHRADLGILAAACAAALAGCVPDLSGFLVVEDAGAVDAGGADAGAADAGDEDGGSTDAGAGRDAGTDAGSPTAIDVACPTRWTDLGGTPTGACAGREVTSVAAPFDTHDVAITRARDGTIVVAFDEQDGPDSARLRTIRFHEDTPATVVEGPAVDPVAVLGELVGTAVALATEAPDIHHLAYWLRADAGSEVHYRTLRGDVLSGVQVLATGVGREGALDVAVDSEGRAAVAWHDDTSGRTSARRERADGTWTGVVTIRTDGDPRLEGPGAVALVPGSGGAVHLAFQWSVTLAASAPSYSISSGAEWSMARTLDNAAIASRASGVGVDLALVGDDVIVAYLDWQGGLGDVRLARVRGALDPEITRYLPDVPIADRPGSHPLAIASDALGRLHLVVADASGGAGPETWLEYHRQTVVGGELRWIRDEIARIPAVPESVRVELVLGPDRRPHVVFWDPVLGEVRYATLRP